MAAPQRRALPTPPGPPGNAYSSTRRGISPNPADTDIYSYGNPYSAPYPNPSFMPQSMSYPDEQPSMLLGGTLLHKGFYDLLSMIPTTPSRMFWREEEEPIAGPRYEEIANKEPLNSRKPVESPPATSPTSPTSPQRILRGRKISKDMVSKPIGFVYVSLAPSLHSVDIHLG